MFTFNGQHASSYFEKVIEVKRDMTAPISPKLKKIDGKIGAYFYGTETEVYEVEFQAYLKGSTRQQLWQEIRNANAWLIQDELKELKFDDEPDLYYLAVVSGALSLEEVLELGFATIKFIVPDSYAYGLTKNQRVESPAAIFDRQGIRYRNDGTEVTEYFPVYEDGKFNKAILIEEGTTNLLPTASNPAQEEVSVTTGSDYYLSLVNGSASVEHKRVETPPKTTLDKEGTDYSNFVDGSWDAGTLSGVTTSTDDVYVHGVLELAKTGTDLTDVKEDNADFSGGSFSGTGVFSNGADDYIALNNQPSWGTYDDMSDLSTWNGASTSGATVVNDSYIRVTTSSTNPTGIDRRPAVSFTSGFTIDFRARTNGSSSFYISDGSVRFSDLIPVSASSGTGWSWYRIRITDSTTGYLYKDGTLVKSLSSSSYTTQRILLGYTTSTTNSATHDFDAVYYTIGADHGAPPPNHIYTGTYISPETDVSGVGIVNTSDFVSTISFSSFYSEELGNITIEFQLGTNTGDSTTWDGSWSTNLPFTKGMDLVNKRFRYRVTLQMRDSGDSPWLFGTTLTLTSGYKSSGYCESDVIDISQVGKAASTVQSWSAFGAQDPNTTITLQTRYSVDGGINWTPYQDTTNGGSIPGITQATDLSNARFQYKFILSTSDISVSPKLDRTDYSFVTGYKTTQTTNIPGVSVDTIGLSSNSILEWVETKPAGTDIVFESSLDNTNWVQVTNGGTLFSNGADLTGKTLYIRYTLSTTDTSQTPTLSDITWYIQQSESNKIKPATTTLRLTPTSVTRWQLENKPYPTGWQAYGTSRNPESMYIDPLNIIEEDQGTFEFWVNEEGNNSVERFMIDSDGPNRFLLKRKVENTYELYINNQSVITTTAPNAGWRYIAITWNVTSVKLYIDGLQVGSATLANPVTFSGITKIYLGCQNDITLQWNGLIDDLRISNVERTSSDIAQYFSSNQPLTVDESTLYKLAFDNTLMTDTDKTLEVGGTVSTKPVMTVTFSQSTNTINISNGSEYIQIDTTFNPGDVLVIDCEREEAKLNDSRSLAMPYIDLDSDFFSLEPGAMITVTPPGVATVDVSFTERWL